MRKAKIQFWDFCTYGQKFNTSLFPFSLPCFQFFPVDLPGQWASCATGVSNHSCQWAQFICAVTGTVHLCPALSASTNCELQALPCLSMLISTKLKPSNSLKPPLLPNLTGTDQRAEIRRQRRNRLTHPSDFLRRPSLQHAQLETLPRSARTLIYKAVPAGTPRSEAS